MRRRVGAAIDLDGVIFRGRDVLKGARDAIERLREADIPFVFFTNGGGVLEAEKADELNKRLNLSFELQEHHVVLSHSPMKLWLENFKKKKVLILGFNRYVDVAKSYGFERAVTPSQLIRADPDRFAFTSYGIGSCHEKNVGDSKDALDGEPFDAIIQLTDCADWLMESQVCLDILRGDSTSQQTIEQCVPYFNSNDDWMFSGRFPYPRLAQGSFIVAISALWRKLSGTNLKVEHCGKPTARTYSYAEQLLKSQIPAGEEIERIYGIGDNPPVDVRGANAAKNWKSILVETGVHVAGESLLRDVPDILVPDIGAAVDRVLSDNVNKVTLFTNEMCTLCDEMKDVLRTNRDIFPHVLEEVNIDERPEYFEKYHLDIPVLHVNGEYVAKHRLRREFLVELSEKLARGEKTLLQRGEPDARTYRNIKKS